MALSRNHLLWLIWLIVTIGLSAFFAYKLLSSEDKRVFLPGETSHGHHQIEMSCNTCHGESFTDQKTLQKSCMNCHGEQLKEAKDDHPKKKFTDPRNADRVAELDARVCVTCHTEHRPEVTGPMGVTLPIDYCYKCHEDVADDRPSHEGMEFDTCASAGCHNYHDNRALYEDFLAKHLHEADNLENAIVDLKPNLAEVAEMLGQYPLDRYPLKTVVEPDAPNHITVTDEIKNQWLTTAHAKQGVNCSACHVDAETSAWNEKPHQLVCKTCHESQLAGFVQGKHGMRLNSEKLDMTLSPMSPEHALIPMKSKAHGTELTCNTCHAAHEFDIETAAIKSCLQCHDDDHSKAYEQSPHFALYEKETSGELPTGSGVTCATCHMPKIEKEYFYGEVIQVLVDHDQSNNLRPNEKMIRPVCMQCHGLGFAIDALADPELVKKNFNGLPARHIESLDLAEDRLKAPKESKGK